MSAATKETAPPEVVTPTPPPVSEKFDHELAGFQSFKPSLKHDTGYIADNDPRVVRNVPADMTVTWATDPRLDNGQHLSLVQALGFRPVRKEEVTISLFDEARMVLRSFEVGPHDYVVVGGGILMVGYRQYRDERRAHTRMEAESRLDSNRSRLDNQGVEQRGTTRSAPLSEVM